MKRRRSYKQSRKVLRWFTEYVTNLEFWGGLIEWSTGKHEAFVVKALIALSDD
jgi:hypothetical protein